MCGVGCAREWKTSAAASRTASRKQRGPALASTRLCPPPFPPPSQVLAGLHAAAATGGRPAPKLLYTVPTGQNPTGCSISEARRARVYRACERYNLLLVEDDPYFYLQFPQGPGAAPGGGGRWACCFAQAVAVRLGAVGRTPRLRPRPAACVCAVAVPGLLGLRRSGSYLSLDTDGRVIRIDSFAKFLAPGGWVCVCGGGGVEGGCAGWRVWGAGWGASTAAVGTGLGAAAASWAGCSTFSLPLPRTDAVPPPAAASARLTVLACVRVCCRDAAGLGDGAPRHCGQDDDDHPGGWKAA